MDIPTFESVGRLKLVVEATRECNMDFCSIPAPVAQIGEHYLAPNYISPPLDNMNNFEERTRWTMCINPDLHQDNQFVMLGVASQDNCSGGAAGNGSPAEFTIASAQIVQDTDGECGAIDTVNNGDFSGALDDGSWQLVAPYFQDPQFSFPASFEVTGVSNVGSLKRARCGAEMLVSDIIHAQGNGNAGKALRFNYQTERGQQIDVRLSATAGPPGIPTTQQTILPTNDNFASVDLCIPRYMENGLRIFIAPYDPTTTTGCDVERTVLIDDFEIVDNAECAREDFLGGDFESEAASWMYRFFPSNFNARSFLHEELGNRAARVELDDTCAGMNFEMSRFYLPWEESRQNQLNAVNFDYVVQNIDVRSEVIVDVGTRETLPASRNTQNATVCLPESSQGKIALVRFEGRNTIPVGGDTCQVLNTPVIFDFDNITLVNDASCPTAQ